MHTSDPSSLTRRGTAQASLMAVLLASLLIASALRASAAAAVTPSKGVASNSFTSTGMPYCSLNHSGTDSDVHIMHMQMPRGMNDTGDLLVFFAWELMLVERPDDRA